MKADVRHIAEWKPGIPAWVLRLTPETEEEWVVTSIVKIGVPPEGNIIGWMKDGTKIVVEVGELR